MTATSFPTTIRLYEIEHEGDLEASIDDLRAAGCREIAVVATDFENETAVVSAVIPAHLTSRRELQRALAFAVVH